jgi:NRAMP (natural resistance-associated macrophage protein)-like metal ion transporter
LTLLGPGLVSGASDDDPATIGTCATIGASLGYATLWTMLFAVPLMAAVQYLSAKIGLVTGHGLAGVLRQHFPRWILYLVVAGLLFGNTINAGADLGAIADSIHMLAPAVQVWWCIPLIAGLLVLVQFWGGYRLIERIFKFLVLSLLAYIGAGILAHPNAGQVLWNTFVPHVQLNSQFLEALVAIAGTTFSPYLYFWQSDQEVEEKKSQARGRYWRRTSDEELTYAAWDVNLGMVASNVVTYFVILATAASLYTHGERKIESATQAAQALVPFAGNAGKILLGVGLIGAGLLAVPVMTTSAGYALSQAFGWSYGLDRPPRRAPQFYGVIFFATFAGMAINYVGISPFAALFLTSAIYGFLCPPLLLILMLVARNRRIMHERTVGKTVAILGWFATVVAFAAAIALVVTWIQG